MPNSTVPDANTPEPQPATQENQQSFQDILSQFEKSHVHKPAEAGKGVQGTVITVSGDSVYLDIGYKTEGILPIAELRAGEALRPGDTLVVSIKGRDPEGYYQLSRAKIQHVTDWESLEKAFNDKATIVGTVTGVVKGGLSVDVGVRAFMPASRSGTHDAAEMEKLVEQEIRCRIIKLDIADEDVVVDRRAILEEEERAGKERRFSEIKEGETVTGTVRSLMEYGAFVDIGGVDGLLHVSDISWGRVGKPADVLIIGQEIEAKVLKVDAAKQRISLGLKQLQPHPWETVAEKYKPGERVRGVVTRIVDFGAFVELEPGIEGLIHISEMSWSRRIKKASDVVKQGDAVEAVILGVNAADKRISLGLKQAEEDPWLRIGETYPVGTDITGSVVRLMDKGVVVDIGNDIEGFVPISQLNLGKPVTNPADDVYEGMILDMRVLEVDPIHRRIVLGVTNIPEEQPPRPETPPTIHTDEGEEHPAI